MKILIWAECEHEIVNLSTHMPTTSYRSEIFGCFWEYFGEY